MAGAGYDGRGSLDWGLDLDLGADIQAHRPPGTHDGVPDDAAYRPAITGLGFALRAQIGGGVGWGGGCHGGVGGGGGAQRARFASPQLAPTAPVTTAFSAQCMCVGAGGGGVHHIIEEGLHGSAGWLAGRRVSASLSPLRAAIQIHVPAIHPNALPPSHRTWGARFTMAKH